MIMSLLVTMPLLVMFGFPFAQFLHDTALCCQEAASYIELAAPNQLLPVCGALVNHNVGWTALPEL